MAMCGISFQMGVSGLISVNLGVLGMKKFENPCIIYKVIGCRKELTLWAGVKVACQDMPVSGGYNYYHIITRKRTLTSPT